MSNYTPNSTTIEQAKQALDLAAATGWRVFPCHADKTPATPHGYKDATNDPADIERLWRAYPGELIGVACAPSGLFALDIDRHPGQPDGYRTLQQLDDLHGGGKVIPTGPMQITPSGGAHALFRLPAGLKIPNNAGKIGPGLDLRSDGYICTGPGYTWRPGHGPDAPLTDAPAWLLDLIRDLTKPAAKPMTLPAAADAAAYWYNRYLPQAREGTRNETLYRMGLQLSWSGVDAGTAERLAVDFAQATGLPESEALRTMRSAYGAPAREPANLPFMAGVALADPDGAPMPAPAPKPQDPAARILLTELGNSRRFTRTFGGRALYVPAWGWTLWDGKRWKADDRGVVAGLGKKIIDGLFDEAQDALATAAQAAEGLKNADDSTRDRLKMAYDEAQKQANGLLRWAMQSQTQQKIQAMLALAESDLPAAVDEFDRDPWLLNCQNGILDLKTGKLRPHDPAARMTKLAGAAYDPEARCPLWLAFLERVFAGDRELIAFIQRAVGYSLTGNTSEQALFFLYGTGNNGKSVFSETLQALLGDYANKTPTDTLMLKHADGAVPNDLARLPGARVVVAAELEQGRRLNESLVKDLTGGDHITARFLHREFFEFEPTFKIWMYGNHAPVIRGTDDGIWRRMRRIPFTVTIPEAERDPFLPEKLAGELEGILAWAIQGCLAWQQHGLGLPEAVKQATASYRADQDVLAAFMNDCVIIGSRFKVTKKALYSAYKTWAEDNGETAINARRFGQAMQERGYRINEREGHTGLSIFTGIGLIQESLSGEVGEVGEVKMG